MNKRVIVVIVILFLNGRSFAQPQIPGNPTISDTTLVKTLIDSSYALSYSDPDQAILFANQALKLSEEIGYKQGVADAHKELGHSRNVKGDFNAALNHFQKGMEQSREIGDSLGVVAQLNGLGSLHKKQTQYEEALKYLFRALKISEQLGLDQATGSILVNIGLINFELDEEQKALEFYHRALKINKRLDDQHTVSINYNNLGLLHSDQGRYKKALKYHFKALKIRQELGYTIRIANSLNNIGRSYMQQNKYEKAIKYLNRALEINNEKDPDLTSIIHENITNVYYSTHKFDSALVHANKTLELSQDFGTQLGEKIGFELLSDIHSKLGNYEQAFAYQQKFIAVKDSILNEEKARQINELHTKYETAKKEKEIALLQKEQERQALIRNAALAVFILIGIIGILVYNRQRLKIQKNETELENTRLKEQKLEQELEFKNKQLTTHTLHLVQKNEAMQELKDKISDLRQNGNGDINKRLQKLQNLVDYSFNLDEDWEQFQIYFEEIHDGFFDVLKERYPDLTPNELRLSALAKLNLSIKETATILGITPDSVKTARYRLRKKLGMETEENLTEFMMEVEREEVG